MTTLIAGIVNALVGVLGVGPERGFRAGTITGAGFAIRSCTPLSTSSPLLATSMIIDFSDRHAPPERYVAGSIGLFHALRRYQRVQVLPQQPLLRVGTGVLPHEAPQERMMEVRPVRSLSTSAAQAAHRPAILPLSGRSEPGSTGMPTDEPALKRRDDRRDWGWKGLLHVHNTLDTSEFGDTRGV